MKENPYWSTSKRKYEVWKCKEATHIYYLVYPFQVAEQVPISSIRCAKGRVHHLSSTGTEKPTPSSDEAVSWGYHERLVAAFSLCVCSFWLSNTSTTTGWIVMELSDVITGCTPYNCCRPNTRSLPQLMDLSQVNRTDKLKFIVVVTESRLFLTASAGSKGNTRPVACTFNM